MRRLKQLRFFYGWGIRFIENEERNRTIKHTQEEIQKSPKRYEVINHLLERFDRPTNYLEIGVRNPDDNFDKIQATQKHSVDPGVEFESNPADFPFTSDEFFHQVSTGSILSKDVKWDVIFIDGLHLADQVERDIQNALAHISDDGIIVLHDCNPPSEWHARENYYYDLTPAQVYWNGTTWKALYKSHLNEQVSVACIDSDWGIGIVMKNQLFPALKENFNPFFEYHIFNQRRKESINLMTWDEFLEKLG